MISKETDIRLGEGDLVLRFRLLSLVLFFGCAFLACTRNELAMNEQVVAKVNGDPIYAGEFLLNFEQLKAEQDEISQKNPKLMDQLKTRALNEVIVVGILRQEAQRRQILVAKEEVEGRLANWKDGYPPGGFEEMLRKQNTTEAYLKKRLEDQLLVEKITEVVFGTENLVSDDEAKAYYSEHEKEFFRPERVHAYQIVVPTKTEAEKIRQEIISNQLTFESAARTYSLSPDASKGGDIGFFAKNEKIAAFNEAFSVNVGQISKPVESKFGVHLLKVVEKKPSAKLAFADAKAEIEKTLKRNKEAKAYREWVTKLLKDGEIHRNEELFAKVE